MPACSHVLGMVPLRVCPKQPPLQCRLASAPGSRASLGKQQCNCELTGKTRHSLGRTHRRPRGGLTRRSLTHSHSASSQNHGRRPTRRMSSSDDRAEGSSHPGRIVSGAADFERIVTSQNKVGKRPTPGSVAGNPVSRALYYSDGSGGRGGNWVDG